MSSFEQYLEELESGVVSEEALEAGADALGFCLALHDSLKENGYTSGDLDFSFLENAWDGMQGELAAASLFLSERSFQRVPEMLRTIADNLEKTNVDDSKLIPTVIIGGHRSLAKRIEATRVQQRQMKELVDTQT